MVTISDLRNFIKQNGYLSLLNDLIGALSLPMDEDEAPMQLFNILAGYVNKSGIALDELEKLCIFDSDRIVKYVDLKLHEIDGEDTYNDDENKDDIVETLPFPKPFLIGHLIEFYFLKNNPAKLLGYLKEMKIPSASKYEKELKSIYIRL